MREHYSLGTEYGAADELYRAIITLDKKRVEELKADGTTLTENVRNVLENGAGRSVSVDNPAYQFRFSLVREIKEMPIKDFEETAAMLRAEIGKPLYYSEALWLWGNKRAFEPRFFEITLDNFNQKSVSKKRSMQRIILEDQIGCLPICEKHGWLKSPRTRDELIQYANENGKTEAAAWLLDFKNRTADIAAERERSEKKIQRELNADPNSLTELRKIWRTKKLEDADRTSAQGRQKAAGCRRQSDLGGTLMITSYRGGHSEVIVPRTLGKDTITAIGHGAFSGSTWNASRTSEEICDLRKENITRITLPETVTVIGENAFSYCSNLKEVNVPYGVKVIEENAFRSTGLEAMELPETVECIKDYAFWGCTLKSIKLPQSLTEIRSDAFCYSWLESIEIPAGVRVIPKSAFWHCANLKEVILHEGIEEIKPAFFDCQALEKINLPASIKKIENYKRDGKTVSPFPDSPKLTATVERGSYAEKYCARNGIRFKYSGEV